MNLSSLIKVAIEQGATDVHLEPTLPVTIRASSVLKRLPHVLSADVVRSIARQLFNEDQWLEFQSRGSFDTTKIVSGVNCRINVMKTDRGVGLAIRLLGSSLNTLKNCNLHPQLAQLIQHDAGLILFTGPTGSGKSTTLAALLEEVNSTTNSHIITLESPIEYRLQPKKSLVRQREIGIHTPSFEQGLLDCLREDPDVIVVGEMREAEVMRLTLLAAETGHLTMATLHASNSSDAVYRMMMSFAPERQSSVLAQLGDSLIAIISQKMSYRADIDLMVPVLEITMASHAVKNAVRKGEASKLVSLLQAGGPDGSWTFERYESWLDSKTDWSRPAPVILSEIESGTEESDREFGESEVGSKSYSSPSPVRNGDSIRTEPRRSGGRSLTASEGAGSTGASLSIPKTVTRVSKDGRIEIPELDIDLTSLANDVAKTLRGSGSDSDDE